MNKNSIRETKLAWLKSQTEDQMLLNGQIICDSLIALTNDVASVACYLPLPNEVPLYGLIMNWHSQNKQVYVPVYKKEHYCFARLSDSFDIVPSQYGVLQPRKIITQDTSAIEVFIVPGIAFDKHGTRIGHGRGIYDMLLAGAANTALKIGVCLKGQLVPCIEKMPHDIQMDYIVTEDGIITCHT